MRETGRAKKGMRKRVGFPDIGGLSSPPWEQRGKKEHLSSSGPIVSRTEPEAHSQADGPYTSA